MDCRGTALVWLERAASLGVVIAAAFSVAIAIRYCMEPRPVAQRLVSEMRPHATHPPVIRAEHQEAAAPNRAVAPLKNRHPQQTTRRPQVPAVTVPKTSSRPLKPTPVKLTPIKSTRLPQLAPEPRAVDLSAVLPSFTSRAQGTPAAAEPRVVVRTLPDPLKEDSVGAKPISDPALTPEEFESMLELLNQQRASERATLPNNSPITEQDDITPITAAQTVEGDSRMAESVSPVEPEPTALLPRRQPIPLSVSPLNSLPATFSHNWSDPAPDLSAASIRAEQSLRHGFGLADRGANYSAQQEMEATLATLAQALDSHYETSGFSGCLQTGLLALEEAADFAPRTTGRQFSVDTSKVIATHRSCVLTADEARQLAAVDAMRRYFAFAQDHLIAASGGSPLAAQALFALGKLHMLGTAKSAESDRNRAPRAMAFHQAALAVNPKHHLAANELGVLLARSGRFKETLEILQRGLVAQPTAESWRNLAIVHERLGETELAQLAYRESQLAAQTAPGASGNRDVPTVRWVDKAVFAQGGQSFPAATQADSTIARQPTPAGRPW